MYRPYTPPPPLAAPLTIYIPPAPPHSGPPPPASPLTAPISSPHPYQGPGLPLYPGRVWPLRPGPLLPGLQTQLQGRLFIKLLFSLMSVSLTQNLA